MSDVSVVIPAFNEEARLKKTITAVRTIPQVKEVIVVDDGSCDKTKDIAYELGDRTIVFSTNKGKGHALQAGWRTAKGEYILCLDADLAESAAEAFRLIVPLQEAEVDGTISNIPAGRKKGFGLVKRRAQTVIYRETGIYLHAPLSGQRAFHRRWLQLLLSEHYEGFGIETKMTLDMLKAGAVLKEVDTNMSHRETGKNLQGFLHRFKQWREIEKSLRGLRH
ncbi:glycosyltransferase family 2 protein [Halalkalibacterium ligniniphilum]|uniref:glycosyltransferase family 2 protein n=1 Tax=Halalkalibacterium ligniniphilum TaxID=1134413 RepID=UPI000364A6C5|nr:glycosyltransferase family 2 protein [Halalkalibacterium ligniniphilum]